MDDHGRAYVEGLVQGKRKLRRCVSLVRHTIVAYRPASDGGRDRVVWASPGSSVASNGSCLGLGRHGRSGFSIHREGGKGVDSASHIE